MKLLAFSIWMFINLTIFAVISYAYVLWNQYWRTFNKQKSAHPVVLHHYNLSAGAKVHDAKVHHAHVNASHSKAAPLKNIPPIPVDKLIKKIKTYKSELLAQLRKAQIDGSKMLFNAGAKRNQYHIYYRGPMTRTFRPPQELTCMAHKVNMEMLNQHTEPLKSMGYGNFFPKYSFEEAVGTFNTCAIISSSGSMFKSRLGQEIDSHDAVLRFNNAPTAEYESDVGTKTTIRMLNSQVVSKPEFDFFNSPLYRNITLIIWDPSKYNETLQEWIQHPDFDLFTSYWLRRQVLPDENFYILDPRSIWRAWDFLQAQTPGPVLHNPPSSGFLGLLLMMKVCRTVDMYEYIPSMRLTKRCHYYDVHEDMGCTMGDWHPLAVEKLLAFHMNNATDLQVFDSGKITAHGIQQQLCK